MINIFPCTNPFVFAVFIVCSALMNALIFTAILNNYWSSGSETDESHVWVYKNGGGYHRRATTREVFHHYNPGGSWQVYVEQGWREMRTLGLWITGLGVPLLAILRCYGGVVSGTSFGEIVRLYPVNIFVLILSGVISGVLYWIILRSLNPQFNPKSEMTPLNANLESITKWNKFMENLFGNILFYSSLAFLTSYFLFPSSWQEKTFLPFLMVAITFTTILLGAFLQPVFERFWDRVWPDEGRKSKKGGSNDTANELKYYRWRKGLKCSVCEGPIELDDIILFQCPKCKRLICLKCGKIKNGTCPYCRNTVEILGLSEF